MADIEREFYLAGGDDLSKALAFIEKRTAAMRAMDEVAAKFGGKAVQNGRFITGLMLDEQPAGWKEVDRLDGKPFYFPKQTSKALKAVAKELQAPRAAGAREFHALFCNDGGKMAEGPGYSMRILYSTWEWVGDTLLLSVPVGSDFTPNGSTPLKMSEYWAMKEAVSKSEAA